MTDYIRIEGIKEVRRNLKKIGDTETPKALRVAHTKGAQLVSLSAQAKAPVKKGRLRASIRAAATQSSGSVKMGRKNVPYSGFVDFGGTIRQTKRILRRPFLKKGRILYPALEEQRNRVERIIASEIDKILKKYQ